MEEVNTLSRKYLREHAAEVAERNYELLCKAVKDTDRWQERAILKDNEVRELRHWKENQWRQMDLALHTYNQ